MNIQNNGTAIPNTPESDDARIAEACAFGAAARRASQIESIIRPRGRVRAEVVGPPGARHIVIREIFPRN